MTDHVARLYALVVGVLAFCLMWAIVAAHPWSPASTRATRDPRVAAVIERRRQVVRESARVRAIVAKRWLVYRRVLRARNAQIAQADRASASVAAQLASAPVRIVTLPPLVITRTS